MDISWTRQGHIKDILEIFKGYILDKLGDIVADIVGDMLGPYM
jgi:hypothetical protein